MTNKDNLTGQMLTEFIKSFQASLDPRLWVKLIEEELKETEEALESGDREQILKEVTDLMYVQIGFNMVAVGAEQLDLFPDEEHGEILVLLNKASEVHGKVVEFLGESTNFFEAFRRVHLSNMSKMGEDGFPVRNEAGKILKGPNYTPPNLKDLV